MNLTARRVAKLLSKGKPGNYYDGQGLRLEIRGESSASWSTRYQIDGVERWMGLGSAKTFTLAEARERNRRLVRQKIADKIDPVAVRLAERSVQAAAAARALTFAEAAERFLAERKAGGAWSSAKHAAQWQITLKDYALPIIGPVSVADVTSDHIFKVLEQQVPARKGYAAGTLWNTRTETAARLRARIEAVLDWATARKHRSGDNPAALKTIGKVLVRPKVVDDTRHAALPFAEIPAFMSQLRQMEGSAARALEFLILTATRSNETLGARWREVDFGTAVWTVPPERMGKTKPREEHKVPLVAETLALLGNLYRDGDDADGFLFIGRKAGARLGSTAMIDVLARMGRSDLTVHGLRSTFRDWAAECTRFPEEVAEHALAHTVGDKTMRAYRRTKLFPQRTRLMAAWAKFCSSPPAVRTKVEGVVVPIGAG
jgi:integrase